MKSANQNPSPYDAPRYFTREHTNTFRVVYDTKVGRRAIICLRCGAVSYNTHDVGHRYCGCCHRFLND